MADEQEKTLEALQIAITMEDDGQKYYLEASEKSGSEVGRKLLKTLAAEEEYHKKAFTGIYEALRDNKGWPDVELPLDGGKRLRTVLSEASPVSSPAAKADSSELDAVQTAIDMEVKTYDFYSAEGKSARYAAEKEFYEKLAAEEREHQLVLVDYLEYLKDPAQWYSTKEHSSLDGG